MTPVETVRAAETHPLDEPLGFIHELAFRLHLTGFSDDGIEVGKAHEKIQRWALDAMNEHDRLTARVATLEAALKQYAGPEMWAGYNGPQIAREALEASR